MKTTATRTAAIGAAIASTTIMCSSLASAQTVSAGATVEYGWTSDEVQNQISYYGEDGKLVKRDVRFRYLPVGFGPEKFGYGIKLKASKKQTIASRAMSSGAFSACTIKVNGSQVASDRNNGGGTTRCS